MKNLKLYFLILLSTSSLFAGVKKLTLKFDPSQTTIEKIKNYDLIQYPRGFSAGNPGTPLLPALSIKILLPSHAEKLRVKLISEKTLLIKENILPYPVQPPVPLSAKNIKFYPPSEEIYSSHKVYPESPFFSKGIGNFGGYRIAGLILTPFKYNPAEKKLYFIKEMEIELVYDEANSCPITENQKKIYENAMKDMIINSKDIEIYSLPLNPGRQSEYDEVIITSSTFASYFQPLVEWRTKTGIRCTVVTTEEIYSSCPGWDEAEKVRNFLIDKYNTWGLTYAVLAGDTSVVPVRKIYSNDTTGGAIFAPSDWYFADMNGGSWDADGDHYYGELEDSSEIDLYGELFVGRMSIETSQEIENIINKILTYEKSPGSWVTKVLLPAVELWPDYQGDFVNDSIAQVTPQEITDIKLYQSLGNLHRNSTKDTINNGVGFVHIAAHGNNQGTYWAEGVDTVLHTFDIPELINGNKLAIYNSIACFPGAFDNMTPEGPDPMGDCFAEKLMYHSQGGPVGVIMNTRFGLGTPPTMGPSDLLDLQFYKRTFTFPMYRFGIAHIASKNDLVPSNWNQSNMPMVGCIGQLTLFGDPAMPMWTGNPVYQNVSHPDSIGTGSQTFTVMVTDNQGPVEGALVCIWSKANGIYETQTTNTSGVASFNISPAYYDTMWVTSTCMNHIPYEGFVKIEGVVYTSEKNSFEKRFLKIYPDIIRGELNLILPAHKNLFKLNILTLSGRNIKINGIQNVRKNRHINLNFNELCSGAYILLVKEKGLKYTRKIILIK